MSVSDKIGSFDWLSVWNLGAVMAFVVALLVQFGLTTVLMGMEGHFGRGRMLSFFVNNGVLIPLYAALVAVVLKQAGASDAWYTQAWWHLACLVVPVVLWVVLPVDRPNFTTAQYLSPSKLAHTLTIIPVGYWLIAPLPALLANFKPTGASVLALVALIGCLAVWAIDRPVYLTSDRAWIHVDWDWKTLSGRPVYKE